ncbi:MAG: hypothetical protein LBU45_01235 [Azoarcus sp.]|nr:hypothetical protein [Azoarcus sp.]
MNKTRLAAVALAGVSVSLAACMTLFDSPPPPGGMPEDVAAQMMNKLATDGEQRVRPGIQEVGVKTQETINTQGANAANALNKAANATQGDNKTEARPDKTTLSFERVDADMPQLAVQGLENAVVLVDDQKMELGGLTKVGRIGLIAPGNRRLRVECPRAAPFSANFVLSKGDRVVLRGNCPSAVAAGGK